METITRATSKTIRLTDTEFMFTQTARSTRESGRTTNRKAVVAKSLTMASRGWSSMAGVEGAGAADGAAEGAEADVAEAAGGTSADGAGA